MNLMDRVLEWIGVEDRGDVESITAAAIGALERQVDEARRWTARAVAAERRLARELAATCETPPGAAGAREALAVHYAAVRQSSDELRGVLHELRAALADARRRQRWLVARCAALEARLAVRRLAHEADVGERPDDVLTALAQELEEASREAFGAGVAPVNSPSRRG